jgi:hypothetical protein
MGGTEVDLAFDALDVQNRDEAQRRHAVARIALAPQVSNNPCK